MEMLLKLPIVGCLLLGLSFQFELAAQESIQYHLNQLWNYCQRDLDSMKYYKEKVVSLSIQQDSIGRHIDAYVASGGCQCVNSYIQEGLNELAVAEQLYLQYRDSLSEEFSFLEPFILFGKGTCYYQEDNYAEALPMLEQVIDLLGKKNEEGTITPYERAVLWEGAFIESAQIYGVYLGEYEKAIQLLEYLITFPNLYSEQEALKYLGDNYFYQGNLDKAKFYHLRCLEVSEREYQIAIDEGARPNKLFRVAFDYITACFSIQMFYRYQQNGSMTESVHYMNKALEIYHKHSTDEISWKNLLKEIYSHFGDIYKEYHLVDSSLYYYQKVLDIFPEINIPNSSAKAYILQSMGTALQTENPMGALEFFNQSILEAVEYDSLEEGQLFIIPPSSRNKKELLKALNGKIGVLSKLSSDSLLAAWHTTEWAESVIDSLKWSYHSSKDKAVLIENSYQIFEKGLHILYDLDSTGRLKNVSQEAYRLIEKSKHLNLLETLKIGEASNEGRVPIDLVAKDRQVRKELAELKQQLAYEQATEGDTLRINHLKKGIFELMQVQNNLIDDIKFNTQRFNHTTVRKQNSFDLRELQKKLGLKQTIIEFFTGEENIFALIIHGHSAHLEKLARTDSLDQAILTVKKLLNQSPNVIEREEQLKSYHQYIHQAHKIYQHLLSKITVNVKTKKWLIIPDGILTYIPFEALITKEAEKNKLNYRNDHLSYLINEVDISYAYSGETLKRQLIPRSYHSEKIFAGFAPTYSGPLLASNSRAIELLPEHQIRNLGALKYNKEEVSDINRILMRQLEPTEVSAFLDTLATEANFKYAAPKASILHLSMHSILNDSIPTFSGLVFNQAAIPQPFSEETSRFSIDTTSLDQSNDGVLFAYDLATMNLQSEMVVLSMCGSESGKFNPGLGLQSLASAFATAGCQSMIASLWQADDRSTAEMMVSFYEQLVANKSKDEALKGAKLKYLSKDRDLDIYYHPYYWATFIQIGNNQPLSAFNKWHQNKYLMLTLAFLIVSLTTAIMLFLFRKSSFSPINTSED